MSAVTPQVRLITYTPDPENTIAMAARICYAREDLASLQHRVSTRDQAAFLQRLVDEGHLSTIEHVTFTFGVEGVSRSLLAQLTRHRLASFSVQSQRYVRTGADGQFDYIIPPAIQSLGPEAVARFDEQMRTMQGWYDEWNQALGARGESSNEDARFVLPKAASTRLMMTMNARELMHFFRLRCCNRAQWEIRAMAWEMLRQVRQVAPTLFALAGPGCIAGACPEKKRSCGKADEVRARHAAWMQEKSPS
nr:FAD-dependent thymidylate synthase [bacterium]